MTHDNTITEVPRDTIRVGERHRKDMGDLDALASSVAQEGLLQPIGVTEDNTLVFGERRLRAVRDVLKRPSITARVVRVSSILAGEFAENEIRKNVTLSERDAIRRAVKAQIPERRGRQNPDNCPELNGAETREISARKAGFSNYKTAERVGTVVDKGSPELIAAMDRGEISVSAASVIASSRQNARPKFSNGRPRCRAKSSVNSEKPPKLPTPSEARRLARKSGMAIADNTAVYRRGSSPELVREAKAEAMAVYTATRGILAIADTAIDPDELAMHLEYWHCPDIRSKSLAAYEWLRRFVKALENNDKIQ
jgi:hypothetical protein